MQSKGLSRGLLQHHSSKTSILWHSAFFIVQLSRPYMTTGKTIALTRWTFAGKVTSLLFNMLSRLVMAFLPRSRRLLISWLQSPSAVIFRPRKESLSLFALFPHLFAIKWWDWIPWSFPSLLRYDWHIILYKFKREPCYDLIHLYIVKWLTP